MFHLPLQSDFKYQDKFVQPHQHGRHKHQISIQSWQSQEEKSLVTSKNAPYLENRDQLKIIKVKRVKQQDLITINPQNALVEKPHSIYKRDSIKLPNANYKIPIMLNQIQDSTKKLYKLDLSEARNKGIDQIQSKQINNEASFNYKNSFSNASKYMNIATSCLIDQDFQQKLSLQMALEKRNESFITPIKSNKKNQIIENKSRNNLISVKEGKNIPSHQLINQSTSNFKYLSSFSSTKDLTSTAKQIENLKSHRQVHFNHIIDVGKTLDRIIHQNRKNSLIDSQKLYSRKENNILNKPKKQQNLPYLTSRDANNGSESRKINPYVESQFQSRVFQLKSFSQKRRQSLIADLQLNGLVEEDFQSRKNQFSIRREANKNIFSTQDSPRKLPFHKSINNNLLDDIVNYEIENDKLQRSNGESTASSKPSSRKKLTRISNKLILEQLSSKKKDFNLSPWETELQDSSIL